MSTNNLQFSSYRTKITKITCLSDILGPLWPRFSAWKALANVATTFAKMPPLARRNFCQLTTRRPHAAARLDTDPPASDSLEKPRQPATPQKITGFPLVEKHTDGRPRL